MFLGYSEIFLWKIPETVKIMHYPNWTGVLISGKSLRWELFKEKKMKTGKVAGQASLLNFAHAFDLQEEYPSFLLKIKNWQSRYF